MNTTRRPPSVTRVFLARHGQTVANREGRFCGQSETDLTPFGQQQARALAQRLAGIEIHAVYTSDFTRAILTAAPSLEGRALTPSIDAALRELHYGEWEMERENAIRKSHPEQHRLMREDRVVEWHPPGGENVAAVRRRTHGALQALIRRHKGNNVLVVSHGTAITCMIAEFLGMPLENTFRFDIAHCAVSEVTVIGRRQVLSLLNDTSHLAGVAVPGR